MTRTSLRVIAYDISSSRRRRQIADMLQINAARVQLSVYEARLTDKQTSRLYEEVTKLLAPGDKFRIYTITDSALDKCHSTGGPVIADGARYWLL